MQHDLDGVLDSLSRPFDPVMALPPLVPASTTEVRGSA